MIMRKRDARAIVFVHWQIPNVDLLVCPNEREPCIVYETYQNKVCVKPHTSKQEKKKKKRNTV